MDKIRLVAGSKVEPDVSNDSATDWRSMWRQIAAIEQVLHLRRKTALGPRATVAFLAGGAVLILVYLLWVCLDATISLRLSGEIVNLVAFGGAILCAAAIQVFSSVPRSYTEKLDSMLIAYEPLSREAFRQLQEDVERCGDLDTHLVVAWMDRERYAIQHAAGWLPKERGFLRKKV